MGKWNARLRDIRLTLIGQSVRKHASPSPPVLHVCLIAVFASLVLREPGR